MGSRSGKRINIWRGWSIIKKVFFTPLGTKESLNHRTKLSGRQDMPDPRHPYTHSRSEEEVSSVTNTGYLSPYKQFPFTSQGYQPHYQNNHQSPNHQQHYQDYHYISSSHYPRRRQHYSSTVSYQDHSSKVDQFSSSYLSSSSSSSCIDRKNEYSEHSQNFSNRPTKRNY